MTRPLKQLSDHDLTSPCEPIAVREISVLRNSLIAAEAQRQATQARLKAKRDLLQKQASEFETLFTCSPVGLAFAQDKHCRVVTYNDAMEKLFGSVEVQHKGLVCMLQGGRRLSREEQPLQRAAAQGESTWDLELELLIEGRPSAFIIVNAVPLKDTEDKPRGAISAVVDITARKTAEARLINAEQGLSESQRLVELAQEVGHVGFFQYQFEADMLSFTPGLVKLFGLAADDTHGTFAQWTAHIDRKDLWLVLRRLHKAFKNRQETETLDYCVNLPAGRTRWLSMRVQISYALDGRPQRMTGIALDISEHKEAERERNALSAREQAARVEAEAANRAKDVFLAMLSHELRNPLSAITAAIEVLNRSVSTSEVETNARKILSRQTRHLTRMMDDLLDVARVISGQVILTCHHINLAAKVQDVLDSLEIKGQTDQHPLLLDIQETWIDADPTRIEQIVNNLVINAIKYTPPGGGIQIRVVSSDGIAQLEVSNSGPGIAPELLTRVFDLFVQGERTLDRRDGGLGVGLTLVRSLVEAHGGSISIENASPGTVVRACFPAIDAPPISIPSTSLPESRRHTVVLIEDNEDVLEGLRTLLESDGHTVWTATDGVSGLALLLNVRPDVAFVDIGLPGMSGFDVARRSRAGGYPGKMVALSGYGQESDREQGRAAGFDFYILKPINSQKLRDLLISE